MFKCMFVLNLIHVKLQYMPGTLLKWWHTGNSVYHIFVLSDNVLRLNSKGEECPVWRCSLGRCRFPLVPTYLILSAQVWASNEQDSACLHLFRRVDKSTQPHRKSRSASFTYLRLHRLASLRQHKKQTYSRQPSILYRSYINIAFTYTHYIAINGVPCINCRHPYTYIIRTCLCLKGCQHL